MSTDLKTYQTQSTTKQGSEYPKWLNNFARKPLVQVLSKMQQGRLEIVTPDGGIYTFGKGQNAARARITVRSDDFFSRCLFFADLGLAESYLDGLCEIESIREVISWFLLNVDGSTVLNESQAASRVLNLLGLINRSIHKKRENSVSNSKRNIEEHYDLGNDFFQSFLDPTMTYSSALFNETGATLAQAQQAKFARIAWQLRLSPGERLLEIGCGWGAFSIFAAKNFDCFVTAITISKEQFDHVSKLIAAEGLEKRIELKLIDYRKIEGSFDKIVSIEMIEAVGEEYIDVYIAKINSLLARNGIAVLQMITCPDSRYETLCQNVDFIQKHIFPGSLLPSLHRVSQAMIKCGEISLIDLFDMTDSYVETLSRWQQNFNKNWHQIENERRDARFKRKWNYYFEYCQAAFDMRNVSVVQATFSRPNNIYLRRHSRT